MRTTIDLDDSVAAELRLLAHRQGVSFRHVVNEALKKSLIKSGTEATRPVYRCPSFNLGRPGSPVDLNKALALATSLEDDHVTHKIELRK